MDGALMIVHVSHAEKHDIWAGIVGTQILDMPRNRVHSDKMSEDETQCATGGGTWNRGKGSERRYMEQG